MVFRPRAATRSDVPDSVRVAELESRLDHLLSLFQRMAEMTATLNYDRCRLSLDAARRRRRQDGRNPASAAFDGEDLTIASRAACRSWISRRCFRPGRAPKQRTRVISLDDRRDPVWRLAGAQLRARLPSVGGRSMPSV
jgi:hypothetical protein